MRTRSPELPRRVAGPDVTPALAGRLPRRGLRTLAGLLGVGLALAGCPSLSVYQTADTLPPEEWEFSAGLDGAVLRDTEQDTRSPAVQTSLAVRRGLAEHLDAGLKLYTFGADAGLRWRLVQGSWSLALAPTVGGLRTRETSTTTDALHLFAHLPLLATRKLSPRWSFTVGPRLFWGLYWPVTGGSAQGWMAGGLVNGSFSLGEHWQLVPELDLLRTVAGEVPVHGWTGQLGLGVAWRP